MQSESGVEISETRYIGYMFVYSGVYCSGRRSSNRDIKAPRGLRTSRIVDEFSGISCEGEIA